MGRFVPRPLPPAGSDVRLAGPMVVIGDGSPLAVTLAAALEHAGAAAVVVHPPAAIVAEPAPLPDETHQVVLPERGSAALAAAFDRIRRTFGDLAGVVVLHPALPGDGLLGEAAGRGLLRQALLAATAAAPHLTAERSGPAPLFATMARLDGRCGTAGAGVGGSAGTPGGAGLFGLARTLAQEWPAVRVRAIDVATDLAPDAAAAALVAELGDAAAPLLTGVAAAGRCTLDWAAATLGPAAVLPAAGDVFLVTGGARGITAACTEALARAARCRFVVLGRTDVHAPEPAWAEGAPAEDLRARCFADLGGTDRRPTPREVEAAVAPVLRRREVAAALERLEEAGAIVRYVAGDVADAEAVARAIAVTAAELGPVTGIIHGAGALADRLVADKADDDFDTVFRPKVDGLERVLAALDPAALRYLVLFSSTAGAFGNAGQADYAMANAVLDQAALRLAVALPSCRVVSIGWGPWLGGMVTPELARRFVERGIRPIPVDTGADLFVRALACPPGAPAHLIVGQDLKRPHDGGPAAAATPAAARFEERRRFTLATDPELAEHRIDGRPVVPVGWMLAWMAAAAARHGVPVSEVRDCRVLKGVVLADDASPELLLTLAPANGSARLAATITGPLNGNGNGSADRPHYAAELGTSALDDCPPLAPVCDATGAGIDPAAYLTGRIAYGPSFRGVQRVLALTERRAVTEIRVPPPPSGCPAGINPYAYDIATHGLLVWLDHRHGAGCLPAAVGRVVWPAPVPTDRPVLVTAAITAFDGERLTADFVLHDAAGTVFAWAEGFTAMVTAGRRATVAGGAMGEAGAAAAPTVPA